MGGHPHGDLAAESAIAAIRSIREQLTTAIENQQAFDIISLVQSAYHKAHAECVGAGDERGCTLVTLLVVENNAWFFNCGDSFGFGFKDDKVETITIEHSGWQGYLTACIGGYAGPGAATPPRVDTFSLPDWQDYQYLVLASDGITNPCNLKLPADNEIPAEAFGIQGLARYQAQAPSRRDNCTVIAIKMPS